MNSASWLPRAAARPFGVLVALATGVVAAVVGAEGTTKTPVKIELKGHEGCPDGDDFLEEMKARSKLIKAAKKDDKSAKTFKVTIKKVGKESQGELVIPTGPFTSSKEIVKAASCDDVVEKLAFFAAHAIDPDALLTPPPEAPESASASASASAPPPRPSASAPPPRPRPVTPPGPIRLIFGAGVAVRGLGDSGVRPSAPVFVEVGKKLDELMNPTLRLSFEAPQGNQITTKVGNGWFKWMQLDLDACPVRVGLSTAVFLRPCAGVEVGSTTGVGGGIQVADPAARTRTEVRPWIAPRLLGRLDWSPIPALFFELEVGVAIPATRYKWMFDSGATSIYQAPAVVPFGVVGLGVRLF